MISFVLHAKNSSGHQYLSIDKQEDGTYGITLLGTLDGQDIQIDFDPLSEYEIQDLANFIAYKREGPSPLPATSEEVMYEFSKLQRNK